MRGRFHRLLLVVLAIGQLPLPPARADGLLDRLKAGRHKQLKQEYHTKEVHHGPPWDLSQIASMVDIVEEGILDDGTVVVKRPDVWSQARMTKYRQDFEAQMAVELSKFAAVLSARVARTDQASLESASSLGVALSAAGRGGSRRGAAPITSPVLVSTPATGDFNQAQIDLLRAQTEAFTAQTDAQINLLRAQADVAKTQADQASAASQQNVAQLQPAAGTSAAMTQTAPFGLLGSKGAFQDFADNVSGGKLGLEPTVYLDEKKRYLDHLNELRRINLGDDNADTAGYSLSLVRMPVSIQSGEKTLKGHGAILTVTARPDFRPDFLPSTFRNFVVQDIVDQFTPILYEILGRGLDQEFEREKARLDAQKEAIGREVLETARRNQLRLQSTRDALGVLQGQPPATSRADSLPPNVVASRLQQALGRRGDELRDQLQQNQEATRRLPEETLERAVLSRIPSTRLAARPYPIAPTDMRRVFLSRNLLLLATAIRRAMPTVSPRASEIRGFLDQTLEPAQALLPYYVTLIDEIVPAVRSHAFQTLPELYARLTGGLPNDLAHNADDPVAILCWAVAVDAGLLDERLKSEMKRLAGQSGFDPGCDLDAMTFYVPDPEPEAREAFRAFVASRWPIIAFALDPVTAEQNIADASSLRRDMTIALSFAFAAGRVNFNQFNRFRRRIEEDAETIALNRTTTAFAHGNETFGWRFYPRFQNPPAESSNFQVIANQLIRGGPAPDYRIRNSKLEPGQRELTAILILPSFLSRVRFEVAGNWFDLAQPDDFTVPTARMVWQGQQVMKLRHALTHYCDPRETRPGDLQRVLAKVDQVEQMLPMQTEVASIPYENAQGGFDLFTPGLASLVPVLIGYDGIDEVEPGKEASFLVFGQHFSIHETKVVAGGRSLSATQAELLSREVMRLTVPADVLSTALADRGAKPFLEVVAATPNGISNRLVIPFRPREEVPTPPPSRTKSNYTWSPVPAYTAYARYTDSGVIDPTQPPSFFAFQEQPAAQIVVNTNRTFPRDPGAGQSPPIPESITHMAMRLRLKDKDGKEVALDTRPTRPNAPFQGGGTEATAAVPFGPNVRDPILAVLVGPNGTLKESRFPREIPITVETYILVEGNITPIRLDDDFTIDVKIRDAATAAAVVRSPAQRQAPGQGPATDLPPALPLPLPEGRRP